MVLPLPPAYGLYARENDENDGWPLSLSISFNLELWLVQSRGVSTLVSYFRSSYIGLCIS
jgi:hypothetical protein